MKVATIACLWVWSAGVLMANSLGSSFYYPLAIKGGNEVGFQWGIDLSAELLSPFKVGAGVSIFHVEKIRNPSTHVGYMAVIQYPYDMGIPLRSEWSLGVAGNGYSGTGIQAGVALHYPWHSLLLSGLLTVNTNQDVMVGLRLGWAKSSVSDLLADLLSPPEPRVIEKPVRPLPPSRPLVMPDPLADQSAPVTLPASVRPSGDMGLPSDMATHWAKDAVKWALDRRLFRSGGMFFPSAVLTGDTAMLALTQVSVLLEQPLSLLPAWSKKSGVSKKEWVTALLGLVNGFRAIPNPQSPTAVQAMAVRLRLPPNWLQVLPGDKPLTRAESAIVLERILKEAGLE